MKKRKLMLPQWIIDRVPRGKENDGFIRYFAYLIIMIIFINIGYFILRPEDYKFLAVEIIIIIALNLLSVLGAGLWLIEQFDILMTARTDAQDEWDNAVSFEEHDKAIRKCNQLGVVTPNKNRINY